MLDGDVCIRTANKNAWGIIHEQNPYYPANHDACRGSHVIWTSYGCTSKADEYVVYAPRDHAVYKISRRGAFFRDENFDVALVYGFSDNRSVAQEMVESLNREEPNTYFFSEVE